MADNESVNGNVEALIEVVEAPQGDVVNPSPVVEPYDFDLLPTTVPPPVKLKGIGATTV